MPRKQIWAYECDECWKLSTDADYDEEYGENLVRGDDGWITEDDGLTFCSDWCRAKHYSEIPPGYVPSILDGIWGDELFAATRLNTILSDWVDRSYEQQMDVGDVIHIPDRTNPSVRVG